MTTIDPVTTRTRPLRHRRAARLAALALLAVGATACLPTAAQPGSPSGMCAEGTIPCSDTPTVAGLGTVTPAPGGMCAAGTPTCDDVFILPGTTCAAGTPDCGDVFVLPEGATAR